MASLVELNEHLQGHLYSHYISANCLWHDDTSPSMLVFADGRFLCQACGKHGSHDDILKRLGKVIVKPAARKTRNPWSGWLDKYGDMVSLCYAAHQNLNQFPNFKFYINKRGITDGTIDNLLIGYFDGFYTVPFKNRNGEIWSGVARASGVVQDNLHIRYIFPNNHTPSLYVPDYQMVRKADKVYCVFGILDAVTFYQCGLPVVTSSIGKQIRGEWFEDIRKPVIIYPDQGEEKQGYKLAGELGWRGMVRQIVGGKDPNEVYTTYGSLQPMGI